MSSKPKSDGNDGDLTKIVNDAISNENVRDLLELLESRRVDVNARDVSHDLTTVLMKVCHMNIENEAMCAITDALRDLPINADVKDAYGRTAMMHSCIGQKPCVVGFLLSLRCDVNAADNGGNTVLTYAIKSGNCEIVESILEQDSAAELIKKRNNMGLLPVDVAKKTNNNKIIKMVEAFYQNVVDSEKFLKRKRSKRRSQKLPPPSYPTSNKPQPSSQAPNKQTTTSANAPSTLVSRERLGGDVTVANVQNKDFSSADSAIDSITHVPVGAKNQQTADDASNVSSRANDVTQNPGDATHKRSDVTWKKSDLKKRHSDVITRSSEIRAWDTDAPPMLGSLTDRQSDVMARCNYEKPSHTFPTIKMPNRCNRVREKMESRRDSVSLPDLRTMRANLVSSGDVNPASADGIRNHIFGKRVKESPEGSDEMRKENRRESVVTDLPTLTDISKFKKSDDFLKNDKTNKRYSSDGALHRSLIS